MEDRRVGQTTGLTALLVLAACAYQPPPYALGPEDEQQLGAPLAAELEAELELVREPAIAVPLEALGQDLSAAVDPPPGRFEFRVVDRGSVNAFSLPGGYVYVNLGLLKATKNMAEVAAVLGHEIAHVVAGHSAERIVHARRSRLGLTVASPWGDRSGALFYANRHRLDESVADSVAVGILVRAGWDPSGLVTFFQSMAWLRDHYREAVGDPFLSHPALEERIEAVRRIIGRLPAEQRKRLRRFTPEYAALRQALDRTSAGDAPPQR